MFALLLLAVGAYGAGYPAPGQWPTDAWRNDLNTNYIIHNFQELAFPVGLDGRCHANGITIQAHTKYECINATAVRKTSYPNSPCTGTSLPPVIITGDGSGGSSIEKFYCSGEDNWVTVGFVAGASSCIGVKWMSAAVGANVCSHLDNYDTEDPITRPYAYSDMALTVYTDYDDPTGLTYMMYFSTLVQNNPYNGCFLNHRSQYTGLCKPGTNYSYINDFGNAQFNSTIQCQVAGLYQHYISTEQCNFLFTFSGQSLYGYTKERARNGSITTFTPPTPAPTAAPTKAGANVIQISLATFIFTICAMFYNINN